MLKMSEKTSRLFDQLLELQEEICERVCEESGGIYALCTNFELKVQLHAKMGHQHDLAELEAFVGPIRLNHTYEDGDKSYHFMLSDKALGCIIMPANTTDSRTTGGEADDVRINKEA